MQNKKLVGPLMMWKWCTWGICNIGWTCWQVKDTHCTQDCVMLCGKSRETSLGGLMHMDWGERERGANVEEGPEVMCELNWRLASLDKLLTRLGDITEPRLKMLLDRSLKDLVIFVQTSVSAFTSVSSHCQFDALCASPPSHHMKNETGRLQYALCASFCSSHHWCFLFPSKSW